MSRAIMEITFKAEEEIKEWLDIVGKDNVKISTTRALSQKDYDRYATQKFNVTYELKGESL